ncbi:hypothetical protein V2E39_10350 [Chryseobacterium arthrosphaerae]|uniref:MlpB protein n=1 Tax=Chryseobacterium arthrosphaerae TaxID=651561 RepID=A0A432DS69_9FLAO|nr:hypothetical protein [Chryseobacterium arthrosphaerae]RTZ45897.1 hypothetical protein EJ377_14280 [Chryseobacterium arthrosphaerae]
MTTLLIRNMFIVAFSTIALSACTDKKQEKSRQETSVTQNIKPVSSGKFAKGDQVPNETVCMVNNAYMGKKQIEVPHNGKIYYGCCEMCVERIPKDQTVREAVDPYTGKTVDKADAYIVMISDGGEVAYFENEENYKKFLAQNS